MIVGATSTQADSDHLPSVEEWKRQTSVHPGQKPIKVEKKSKSKNKVAAKPAVTPLPKQEVPQAPTAPQPTPLPAPKAADAPAPKPPALPVWLFVALATALTCVGLFTWDSLLARKK